MKQITLLMFISLLYANNSCIESYRHTDNYNKNKASYKINFISFYGADKYAQYQIKILKKLPNKKIESKYMNTYILSSNKQPIIGNNYIATFDKFKIVSLYSCKNKRFLFKEKNPIPDTFIKSLIFRK